MAQGSWTTVAPEGDARRDAAATGGLDGRVYVLGGATFEPTTATDRAEAYNPTTSTWTALAPLPIPLFGFAVVAGPDGNIYTLGGVTITGQATAAVEIYNPSTNAWSTGVPLPASGSFFGAAGGDGRLYIFSLNASYAFNLRRQVWSPVASPPLTYIGQTIAEGPDGKIYLFGGAIGGTGNINLNSVNTVESYDPGGNTWSQKASMPTARDSSAAVSGPDGKIYVMGGINDAIGGFLTTVEAYNPATDTWSEATSLPSTLADAVGGKGGDGRIYVTTGTEGPGLSFTGYNDTTYAFNPFGSPTSGGTGTGLMVTNYSASAVTSSSATVTWTTNVPANSVVNYSVIPPGSFQAASKPASVSTVTNSTLTTQHSLTLPNLIAGTHYGFQVQSTDAAGDKASGPNESFVTPAENQPNPNPKGPVTIGFPPAPNVYQVTYTLHNPLPDPYYYLSRYYKATVTAATINGLSAITPLPSSGFVGGDTVFTLNFPTSVGTAGSTVKLIIGLSYEPQYEAVIGDLFPYNDSEVLTLPSPTSVFSQKK